ncbi:Response regulator [Deinococcus marmoris]|uniref:Response regulator n=1 Tax=Deinococcus marmoris TaxID=249408 RepID=A0A1U7NTJ5_9DEIO|nr:Response regulator [Deinococcus marmoris]
MLPANAVVARWHGDDFVAVVPGVTFDMLDETLCRLQDTLSRKKTGEPVMVYGLAPFTGPAGFEAALALADHELYFARSAGEGPVQAAGEDRGLFELSRQLELLETPEDIIGCGLRQVRQLLQFEVAGYYLLDGADAQAVYLDHDPSLKLPEALGLSQPIPLNGLAQRTLETRRTQISVDYQQDPAAPPWTHLKARSVIMTPVIPVDTVTGLLALAQISRQRALPLLPQRVLEQAALRLGYALELQGAVQEVRRTLEGGMLGLGAALEARDLETRGHTARVVHLSSALGQALNLNPQALDQLRQGAYLHDIGKLSIPDRILLKAGPLTPEERSVMQSHVIRGADIAGSMPILSPDTLAVIRSHHERWDGAGYPDGLRGAEIALLARIFAVTDVYDALTSERPYKLAWTVQAARREIAAQAGRQFDPQVVAAFLTLPDSP